MQPTAGIHNRMAWAPLRGRGGADLQLGLSKLLALVQSLERALEDARQQHFNMSIRAEANIVRPLDPCSSIPATDEPTAPIARRCFWRCRSPTRRPRYPAGRP